MTHNSDNKASLLKTVTPSRPFVFLFLTGVAGLLFFAVFRLIFLLSFTDRVGGVSLLKILLAFAVGVRFDLVVILFILMLLLLLLPWIQFKVRFVRICVVIYLGLLFGLSFLGLLADIPFYKVFDSRLNFQAIEYLGGGRTTWHLILSEPRFYLSFVIWLLALAAFVSLVWFIIKRTEHLPHRRSWNAQIGWLLICLALSVLGIRGRLQLSPIDWGAAYISQNQFVNQLGLNGIARM